SMFRSVVAVSSRVATGARALSTSAVSKAAPTNAEVEEVFKDRTPQRRHAYSLNRVELLGGVAATPKRLVAKNGNDYLLFNVITNHSTRTASGEFFDQTDMHTVTVFGRQVDDVEAKVDKGSRVLVHGRLRTFGGQLKEDGSRAPRQTSIQAESVQVMAKRGGDNNNRKNSEYDF
ncbi:hypothetical protein PMAYCL1PPCAC_11065, partial [Pristionchus mayeri]